MNKYRFMTIAALGLAAWVCGAQSIAAQQAPAANGIPARMVVTVEPHHGSDVPVINREDVMVYEGKDRDTVTEWVPAQGDRAGLELFILLDDGSSSSLGTQLDDVRKFINAQPPSTKIGVAYMDNGIGQDRTDSDQRSCGRGQGAAPADGNQRGQWQPLFLADRPDQTLAGKQRTVGKCSWLRMELMSTTAAEI